VTERCPRYGSQLWFVVPWRQKKDTMVERLEHLH
jgi:hypothetical protein